jgi:hypothetical protein
MRGQNMTGDDGKMTTLDTDAKREAFRFYLLHGLHRHLKDCVQICKDLEMLQSETLKLCVVYRIGEMMRDFEHYEWFLRTNIPGVEKWIEVPVCRQKSQSADESVPRKVGR